MPETGFSRLLGTVPSPTSSPLYPEPTPTDVSAEEEVRAIFQKQFDSEQNNLSVNPNINPNSPEGKQEDISAGRKMEFGFAQAMSGSEEAVGRPDWLSAHKYLTTEHPDIAMKMGLSGAAGKDLPKELDESWLSPIYKYMDALKTSTVGTLVNMLGTDEQLKAWEEETYKNRFGENWSKMTPEQRRGYIQREADAQLKKDFPEFYDNPELKESGWVTAGNIGATLTSPTTILGPTGQSYKAAAAIGAGWGAFDMALLDLADRGKIDPIHVAAGTVGGAVFAPVIKASVAGAGKGAGYVFDKVAVRHRFNMANKTLDRFEKALAQEIKAGVPKGQAKMYAQSAYGLESKTLTQMYKVTGRTIEMPKSAEAAGEFLMDIEERAGWFGLNRAINKVGETLDPWVTPIIDRIAKMSPKMAHELRGVDFRSHLRTHSYFSQVNPWLDKVAKMSNADQRQVKIWLSADSLESFHKAGRLMHEYAGRDPEKFGSFVKDWIQVRKVLKDVSKEYKAKGYDFNPLEHFFPRVSKHPKHMGPAHVGMFHKMVSEAADKKGSALTHDELGVLMRQAVRRVETRGTRVQASGHLRSRTVDEVTEFLEPYYASTKEALHSYLRMASNDIERVSFFQKMGITKKEKLNIDKVGLQVNKDINTLATSLRGLNTKEREQLITMLNVRFGSGENAPHRFWQHFKNLGYTVTLGNPISALTQLGDQAFSMYKYNIREYLKGWVTPDVLEKSDLGLSDAIEELFANSSKTKIVLDKFMKASGFNALDTFGKNRILNTAYIHYRNMVKTGKGAREFSSKWGRYFEEETPQLIRDLHAGNMTDNVKLLLWHELADVQPIALSEMPEKYLASPNGRVLYMLKTFFIKQISFLRRNVTQEMAHGNYGKAIKNATAFTGFWVLANGTADGLKSVLTGEKFDIADNMVENMMQMVGLNKYQTAQLGKEGPVATAYDFLMPPIPFVDNLAIAAYQNKPELALRSVPYFGTTLSKRARVAKERRQRLGRYENIDRQSMSPRESQRARSLQQYENY